MFLLLWQQGPDHILDNKSINIVFYFCLYHKAYKEETLDGTDNFLQENKQKTTHFWTLNITAQCPMDFEKKPIH